MFTCRENWGSDALVIRTVFLVREIALLGEKVSLPGSKLCGCDLLLSSEIVCSIELSNTSLGECFWLVKASGGCTNKLGIFVLVIRIVELGNKVHLPDWEVLDLLSLCTNLGITVLLNNAVCNFLSNLTSNPFPTSLGE
ncbi:MAG: hypothetical protein V7K99_13070 [Nostoc sp.]